MINKILTGLEQMEIESSENTVKQLALFLTELVEQNKVMNLTAITNVDDMIGLHLLDSLYLLHHIPSSTENLIDIGTGAGFPAIPLKIMRPSLEVTLLDSLNKRLLWLDRVIELLELDRINIVHGRGEDKCHDKIYREQFDVATLRAVAEMRIIVELSLPYLKVGGTLLAMKSIDSDEEIKLIEPTIALLGGKIINIVDYTIPTVNVVHRLVEIKKVDSSPDKFPRRWSKIQKSPLF